MKTKLLLFTLLASVFSVQIQGQDRTTINAKNVEISDNLDLRAVASIFGDSRNLRDFERRLNDPEIQISNLDLNYDNQVDYLRVIESVENRTHVIIIQAVLDRDVYQDVATIDVEKDIHNKVQIQVVGDVYMYGPNYIYEPIYYNTPVIYGSLWISNYRPYCSTWYWNYYPSYYYAWNPFPVYRYRHNIHNHLNNYNTYNYVNYRSNQRAVTLYTSKRSNGYEKQHPNHSFSSRNYHVTNRYELDKKRIARNVGSGYNGKYSQNRNISSKSNNDRRIGIQRNYSQNNGNTSRQATPQRTENQRSYAQNNGNTSRQATPQRTENQRNYSQNNGNTSRQAIPQRTENQRSYSQNNGNTSRQTAPQRIEAKGNSSQERNQSQNSNSTSRNNSRRL